MICENFSNEQLTREKISAEIEDGRRAEQNAARCEICDEKTVKGFASVIEGSWVCCDCADKYFPLDVGPETEVVFQAVCDCGQILLNTDQRKDFAICRKCEKGVAK